MLLRLAIKRVAINPHGPAGGLHHERTPSVGVWGALRCVRSSVAVAGICMLLYHHHPPTREVRLRLRLCELLDQSTRGGKNTDQRRQPKPTLPLLLLLLLL